MCGRNFALLPAATCMLSKGWSRSSLSFISILQSAASRAWTRRAEPNFYSTAVSSLDEKIAGSSSGPYSSREASAGGVRLPRIHHFHFDRITDEDVSFSDPGRCSEPVCWDDGGELGVPVARYPFRPRARKWVQPSKLPPATSRNVLYRNLVLLSCRVPPITLPQLIDYHALYPETHSTRSYNFLINMAIRTASFGSAQWLLESMERACIPRNLETYKLLIRWQIRTGAWDAAWRTLTEPGGGEAILQDMNKSGWPDFLWLEFFGSLKRKSLRRKGAVLVEGPKDSLVVYTKRYLQVMEKHGTLSLADARPRVVHSIVHALLRLGQNIHALRLAQTYFGHLPAHIGPEISLKCLEIIHVLIVFGSRARGRKKFREHRRILNSLLGLHSSFKPTPTTLYLLLGSLRGAIRCGALASGCLGSFKRRWGADIEDGKVRLRIASLGLKQGRLDITREMLSVTAKQNGSDEQRILRRPRFKRIFRGVGALWALEIRLRRRYRLIRRRRIT
ncbi:hypothetical protein D9757_005354 [Collybiopsis confluens]|uniref:Uncharacterized protein n=1 Tax=Collybiopsis confluens TaxID=2823264 RepID=A0A8H5M9J1_9AGAR|nr:hypothetical protein D9757_005354 [Collybiopsis confluens]